MPIQDPSIMGRRTRVELGRYMQGVGDGRIDSWKTPAGPTHIQGTGPTHPGPGCALRLAPGTLCS